MISDRIAQALIKQSFLPALTSLGFVRTPEAIDKVSDFRRRYANTERALISGAISTVLLTHVGMPGPAPKISIGVNKRIPIEVIDKIRAEGIESSQAYLRRLFTSDAQYQLAYNSLKVLYGAALQGFAVYMVVQMWPTLSFILQTAWSSEELLEKVQDATFDPERIREMQFKSWKAAFLELEGREPDPVRDANEWNRVREMIWKLSDAELRVKFRKKLKSS